ncbi:hypothetical protein NC651_002200 [Populus alba x Populus x berolinensis]|nr:hypothetical protein NC651_002200 [Populus alba x Populus x berolinensis]
MIRGIYHFSPILRLSTLPIFLCYVVCEQTCSPLTGTHIADNLGRTLESEHLLVGVFRWLEDSLPIIALLVKWQAAVESCAFSILYFFDSPVFHPGIALFFLSGFMFEGDCKETFGRVE